MAMVNGDVRRVIFFDVNKSGHVPSHLSAFADEVLRNQYDYHVIFCMHPEILSRLPEPIAQALTAGGRKASFVPLTADEIDACSCRNPTAQGIARWRVGQDLARRLGAEHVFYFTLDIIFAGALLDAVLLRESVAFSGILFRPRLHLKNNDRRRSPLSFIKKWRQLPYYSASFALRKMTTVWTLDPFFPDFAAKRLPRGEKVKFLSEQNIFELADQDILNSIPPRRANAKVRFLMFGLLKERKGVLVLLAALAGLSASDWRSIEVLLLGEFDSQIREQALAMVATIRSREFSNLTLIDKFVPVETIVEEVIRCDVLLANYLDHVGSSGVAFAAATFGKPIVTQSTGLLGRLTETFGLGSVIDTSDPRSLATEMVRISQLTEPRTVASENGQKNYLMLNSVPFAPQILGTFSQRSVG